MRPPTRALKEFIGKFQPNIFADESPDTTNEELLALLPNRISVDIPREEKLRRNLYILARNEARLCPYVDREREEYWKSKMDDAIRSQPSPRILFLCGSNHLYSFREKPVSFPDILRNAGYSVECCDLRKEHCWNESWTKGWIDPDPPHLGAMRRPEQTDAKQENGYCKDECQSIDP